MSTVCTCFGCRTRGLGACGCFLCEACGFESMTVLRRDDLSNNHYCAPCWVALGRRAEVVAEPVRLRKARRRRTKRAA